jgi:hypothetical protein
LAPFNLASNQLHRLPIKKKSGQQPTQMNPTQEATYHYHSGQHLGKKIMYVVSDVKDGAILTDHSIPVINELYPNPGNL